MAGRRDVPYDPLMRRALLLFLIPIVFPHTGIAQTNPAADSLYLAGDYAGAALAYETVARQHPDSGRAWYRLGNSLYQTKRYDAAIAALQKATATLQPASYAHYLLAQVYADAGRPDEAVDEIRRTAEAQGVPYAVLAATPSFTSLEGNAAYDELMTSLNPCSPAEYRQFDFWIGEWAVQTPAGQPAGFSRIESDFGGCVILEHWSGLTGIPAGTSQNFYHKADGRWHQNWIDAQSSNPLWLVGGLDEKGAMVMMDADRSANPLNRITWTPNPDGTVRQHWEQSTDGGATWTTAFDGLYVPREPGAD
ncbi:MAG TPA: tetratricopeptide repeat protein [Gemmatimonadota bacterium]|nr:tetratricopeptide repeat protein [Gemmatimonadota bacterium]